MNFNNFLDGSPSAHPRLINNPRQHNSSSSGGAALDPCTFQPNTPQPSLDDAWQAGFTEALQPAPSNLGRYESANQETTPLPASEWNNGYNYEEVGAYGGANLEHEPRHADPAGTGHAPGGAGSRGRTLRMHEWLPQSDPELERRRLRAVRQWQKRQREQQEAEHLQRDFDDAMREVTELSPEVNRLRRQVHILEQYAAQQGYSC
ncbi:uncharacterized protein LOC126986773 [Eriocheir sinensis]|uniref:uncharacterized protein LOC126986773 n=1 Tax=Eriocheir sinensis TaxID=95602 RepID=UPI0021C6739F|nr:uncharacterized protein LOC126986773 [Eriocheir sinensis]